MASNQEQSHSGFDFSKDSSSPMNNSQSRSRLSTKRLNKSNEFLNSQLDPDRINEYITLLTEFEKTSISERKFKDAELAALRIEELKQQEAEYRTVAREEQTFIENEELEGVHARQADEFNNIWDKLIEQHVEQMKNIELDMVVNHEEEVKRFDEEVAKLVIPKPKFSKDVLNMQHMFNSLLKAKKYTEAEDVLKRLESLQKKETEKWNSQFFEKFARKRELLLARQKNELQVLQEKLQNSLHEKLRMRVNEQDRLFQRFQNLKNELVLKQAHDISKLNLIHNKVKKSMTLTNELPARSSPSKSMLSSRLETSKILSQSRVGGDRE